MVCVGLMHKVKIKIPKGLVTSKLGRNCENKQDIEDGFGNIDYVFIGGNRYQGNSKQKYKVYRDRPA